MGTDNEKLLGKLAALLRKAEETDNDCEAVAYMEAAQRIATASSIDLAAARKYHSGKGPKLIQETISIGAKGTKGLKSYISLYVAIARANDVQCDVLRDSTTIFAFGYDSDIRVCQQLYQSLIVQMVTACQKYLTSNTHKLSVQEHIEYRKRHGIPQRVITRKPVATITARLNFHEAYAERIGHILLSAGKKEVQAHEQTTQSSQALVLLIKKADTVTEYYRKNSSARGRWSPKNSPYIHDARKAGNAAA